MSSSLNCSCAAGELQEKPASVSARAWLTRQFDRIAASRGYQRDGEVTIFQDTPALGLSAMVKPLPGKAAARQRGEIV